MLKKVLIFVDGENLVLRYQAMKDSGRLPTSDVTHSIDAFVWASSLTAWSEMDVIRVSYYTSVTGDDQKVRDVTDLISRTRFHCKGGSYSGEASLIPRVHKKLASSQKTKVVDVDITMDVMRAALTMPVDGLFIVSGDGDYLSLVREVTRTTSKQVYLGALSSGLDARLRSSVDEFIDLDRFFFQ